MGLGRQDLRELALGCETPPIPPRNLAHSLGMFASAARGGRELTKVTVNSGEPISIGQSRPAKALVTQTMLTVLTQNIQVRWGKGAREQVHEPVNSDLAASASSAPTTVPIAGA
jgi:hypothetical protein